MLKVSNFSKKYGKITAVDNISFTINPGEITGLLGPNGAGKTTTMKSVAGLLRLTSGSITIAGHENTSSEAKRKFGYIPEVPELYDMLTVREHLRFISYAYGVGAWEPRADRLLERFELFDKKDSLAKELSKGMKQKLSFCCALLPDHELYLFDEPMVGLDPKAIRETKLIFRELSEAGKAIFVSTHLLDMIENLCSRLLVMKNGKIIADGTVESLRQQLGESGDSSLEDIFLEVTRDE